MLFKNGPERHAEAAQNRHKISAALKNSHSDLNLKFLNIKDYPLGMTDEMVNQIMVVYKNGKFEVLPVGMHGERIRDYLGVHFQRIILWTALPIGGHHLHPLKRKQQGYRSPDREIYADW